MQAAVDASALMMAKDAKVADAAQLATNARNYFDANFQNTEVGHIRNDDYHILDVEWLCREHVRHRRCDNQIYGDHGFFESQSGGAFQRNIQRGRSWMCAVA